ncbi:hypothetical protein TSUD_421860, partial [Trifolium subterraneum]
MDRSTAKAMYDSQCSNYDGNRQVQNAKARLLVQQYKLFTMKPDEDIETIFSRFQTLVSSLRVLKKSYTTSDHVWKILNSLTDKWRPKVTAIEEAKDLEKISLESLISNLKSHEMDEEDSSSDDQEEEEDEELAMFTRNFQKWARMSKSRKGNSSRSTPNREEKNCFKCNKPGHFIAKCPEASSKDKNKKFSSYKRRFQKSLMATFEDLEASLDSDDEEANVALMATANEDSEGSDSDESDSDESEQVLLNYSKEQLLTYLELENGCTRCNKPTDEHEVALQEF